MENEKKAKRMGFYPRKKEMTKNRANCEKKKELKGRH
jgi:hypothetical protein